MAKRARRVNPRIVEAELVLVRQAISRAQHRVWGTSAELDDLLGKAHLAIQAVLARLEGWPTPRSK